MGERELGAQLLAVREDDPGWVILGRQELSGVLDGHSSKSSHSGGQLGPELGPVVLEPDKEDNDCESDKYSEK